jgi:hypothetical protein
MSVLIKNAKKFCKICSDVLNIALFHGKGPTVGEQLAQSG